MNSLPRRRLFDRLRSAPSLLAPDAQLVGDIQTQGALLINGTVRGNGRVGGDLGITAGAHWIGDVHARSAVIAGELIGTLVIEDTLEIGTTAHIKGRVMARSIAVARGAIIDGELIVTGSSPLIEFEERRAALPQT